MNFMRLAVYLLSGIILFSVILFSLSIISYFMLPKDSIRSYNGITTIDEAVQFCRNSGKTNWELAALAQNIVADKMEYSRRNHWDTTEKAFERGMGYCIQQSMVLRKIYERLGIKCRLVQAFKNKFPAGLIHGIPSPQITSGHCWLRVKIQDLELDVCPGDPGNIPGKTGFIRLSEMTDFPDYLVPVTHIFCVMVNMLRDWGCIISSSYLKADVPGDFRLEFQRGAYPEYRAKNRFFKIEPDGKGYFEITGGTYYMFDSKSDGRPKYEQTILKTVKITDIGPVINSLFRNHLFDFDEFYQNNLVSDGSFKRIHLTYLGKNKTVTIINTNFKKADNIIRLMSKYESLLQKKSD